MGRLTSLRPAGADDVPAIRAWQRAGFVEVSRGHAPDEDHAAPWVLMEFRASD
jgi:hypothetical protein